MLGNLSEGLSKSLKGFIFDYSSIFVLCVPQVLLTLCTCCFTVTVGAYACILQGEEMSSPKGNELTGAWGMQLYCAAIFILLILISGQLVTNAVSFFLFLLTLFIYLVVTRALNLLVGTKANVRE
jgi:hypothetical protein